jgi:hypothetical protein
MTDSLMMISTDLHLRAVTIHRKGEDLGCGLQRISVRFPEKHDCLKAFWNCVSMDVFSCSILMGSSPILGAMAFLGNFWLRQRAP